MVFVQSASLNNRVIFVTGRCNLYGCETSRLPHFLQNWLTDGIRLTLRPPYTPGRFLIILSEADYERVLEGLDQLKNAVISSGIEPNTFWLGA
jgi:hypothetical protein